jgi:hypothetical protein
MTEVQTKSARARGPRIRWPRVRRSIPDPASANNNERVSRLAGRDKTAEPFNDQDLALILLCAHLRLEAVFPTSREAAALRGLIAKLATVAAASRTRL